jgi:hypothetical protein
MARTQTVVETVTCDLCGKPAQEDLGVDLGWNGEQWRVDLCRADHRRVAGQFDKWIANGEPLAKRAGGRRPKARAGTNSNDDWAYLETRGFTRHRGRKSAAELEALAQRSK